MSSGVAGSSFFTRFQPMRTPLLVAERIYAAVGGLLGLLTTGVVMHACLGPTAKAPLLDSAIGASTVLDVRGPREPARPALVRARRQRAGGRHRRHGRASSPIRCAPAPPRSRSPSASRACSGACTRRGRGGALGGIGGPAIGASLGYHFALVPVAINSPLLLVAAGLLFNNLVRRSYPHVVNLPVAPHGTADAPPEPASAFHRATSTPPSSASVRRSTSSAKTWTRPGPARRRGSAPAAARRPHRRRDHRRAIGHDSGRTIRARSRSAASASAPCASCRWSTSEASCTARSTSRSRLRCPRPPCATCRQSTPRPPARTRNQRALPAPLRGRVHEALMVDAKMRLRGW